LKVVWEIAIGRCRGLRNLEGGFATSPLGNRYPWFEKGLRKPTPTLPYARGSVSARNRQRFIGEIERYVKIDCSVSIETLPILK